MHKILVPVDFSPTAENALLYALEMFGSSNSEITALHTYALSSNAFHMISMDRILEEDAQRDMTSLIKKIQAKEPAVKLKSRILKGDAVTAIASFGDSGNFDYIVMGTHGASGLKEVFIGSVAGGVISKTKAPVIVVPDKCVFRPLDQITLAIGGVSLSDESVVEPLRKLVKMNQCKINVVHIAEGKKLDLESTLATIDDLNPSVTYAFGEGSIDERLTDHLEENDVQLLCLIKSRKGFFHRIFGGSVTLKQTFHSPAPLLILHN